MKVVDSLNTPKPKSDKKARNKASNKEQAKKVKPSNQVTFSGKTGLSKDVSSPIIAFFMTLFLFLFILTFYGMVPFGNVSMLTSDLKAQYAPYLIMFKHHIRELDFSALGSSFTYTTILAFGKNFMSTFGYYMSSPLNWIVFLFQDYQIDLAVITIIAIKISLSSAFMTLFLRKRATNKESLWPLAFGVTYAFTSFTIVFMFTIIWLDGYALLPLLLYFVEEFIEKKKKLGLIVTLILLFTANLYVSYMVGVFSFFYLIARLIYKGTFDKNITAKEAVSKVVQFVTTAIVCVMTLGTLIVPVGLDIVNNRDVLITNTKSEAVQFKAMELIEQIFLGNLGEFNTKLSHNLPFIFVGLFVTLFISIFFVSKVFDKKIKYYYATVLVLIFLSFNITFIDIAWQAFDNPNWFCHRYSFVFFPVFYVIALKTIEKIKEIQAKEIVTGTLILVALLMFAQSFLEYGKYGFIFLVNLVLLVGYALLLLGMKKEKWPEQLKNMQRLSCYILAFIIVIEGVCINTGASGSLSSFASATDSITNQYELAAMQESVRQLNTVSNPYFRIGFENSTIEALDDHELPIHTGAAPYGNFRSVNIFDSSSNKTIGRFMKQLGHVATYNYFMTGYGYIAKPTDAFFSMPFVMKFEDNYSGLSVNNVVSGDRSVITYGNSDILPIGFAVDSGAMNFDYYQLEKKSTAKDYFKFQNEWYKSMFPEEFTEDFYRSYRVIRDTDTTLYNGEYVAADKFDYEVTPLIFNDPTSFDDGSRASQTRNSIVRTNSDVPIVFVIKYVVQDSGEQYFCPVAQNILDEMTIYMDKKEIEFIDEGTYFSKIIRLGYFEEGEEIELVITVDKDSFSYQDFYFGTVDDEKFTEQLKAVDTSKVAVTKFKTGDVVFDTNMEEGEVLLTTIPYEKGWTCYVDGVEKEITPYQDALISVDTGAGAHKVELKFLAPGVKPGLVMSAIGVLSLVAIFVIDNKKKK